MPRPTWKGSISFGLVNVPVTLYPAEDRAEQLHFNLLDARDSAPIAYQRVNKHTGKEVPWEKIVKGFELDDGQYVLIADDDFKKANPKASQTIEILDFVDEESIDPAYFDTPYYLEPGKKGAKGYALLREALTNTGKVGIAKVVIRTKQHLAALTARGPALVLETLRWAHELRDPKKLELPSKSESGVSPKEVQMAERLVEGMVVDWKPERYRDDFTEDMLALIKKKAKHGEIETVEEPDEESPVADVLDLMPLLKKSLESRSRGGKKAAGHAAVARASRATGAKGRTTKKKATRRRTA